MTEGRYHTLLGVTVGHAVHDTWFGVAPILLAALSAQMGLNNSEVGLMMLLYQALSSITQPFFGRLSERVGGRPLAVTSILWTTLMFSGALFAESKVLLAILITLAGLGSGAYHPQGAANATIAGGERRGATAAAVFFLGGTLGMAFLGSALGGYLLSSFGRRSLLVISAITTTLALTAVRRMVPRWVPLPSRSAQARRGPANATNGAFWALLAFLVISMALRSLTNFSLDTYIPKYQQDLGISPATYGLVMSVFLLSAAVGGVAGSYLADRAGVRRVLVGSMVLGAGFLAAFVRTQGFLSYVLLAFSGLLIGPSHTLLIVAGQRQFPERVAMVSGVFMGFTFISGSGGAWVLGWLADRVGLGTMLGVLPWALIGAALCALVGVPGRQVVRAVPQEESAA
jgi:FSR family fosmidomycin resistance protein-like MFS transporter